MGCIWSSESSKRCSVCNCKQSRDSFFINNKCFPCRLAEQSKALSLIQHRENNYSVEDTSIRNLNRINARDVLSQPKPNTTSNARGVLPQPRPNTTSNVPQFGEFHCKPCGRRWKSLRSWSNKHQLCKRCKHPVFPHKLRELLSSDFKDDSKEHEMELCQMCKQLGYSCKNYGKNVYRRYK